MSITLMSRVWDETQFKGTELLILLCLADHANDDGVCWPSYGRLAKRARCSRRHAIRCVERLVSEGWITVTERRITDTLSQSNLFKLCLPPSDAASPPPCKTEVVVTPTSPPGDNRLKSAASNVTGVVTPVSPKPSGESSVNRHEPPCSPAVSKMDQSTEFEEEVFHPKKSALQRFKDGLASGAWALFCAQANIAGDEGRRQQVEGAITVALESGKDPAAIASAINRQSIAELMIACEASPLATT